MAQQSPGGRPQALEAQQRNDELVRWWYDPEGNVLQVALDLWCHECHERQVGVVRDLGPFDDPHDALAGLRNLATNLARRQAPCDCHYQQGELELEPSPSSNAPGNDPVDDGQRSLL